jgi:hypothetical protein
MKILVFQNSKYQFSVFCSKRNVGVFNFKIKLNSSHTVINLILSALKRFLELSNELPVNETVVLVLPKVFQNKKDQDLIDSLLMQREGENPELTILRKFVNLVKLDISFEHKKVYSAGLFKLLSDYINNQEQHQEIPHEKILENEV